MAALPTIRRVTLFASGLIYLLAIAGVLRVSRRAELPAVVSRPAGELVVTDSSAGALPEGLRAGDRIVAINGHAVTTQKELEFIVDGQQIGGTVELEIVRGGQRRRVQETLVPFYRLRYVISQFFVGSFFAFLGFLVLLRRPEDEAGLAFHWACLAASAIIMATWGNVNYGTRLLGFSIHTLFSAANAFLPALCVHFSLLFPKKKMQRARRLVLPLYGLSLLLTVWLAVCFYRASFQLSLADLGAYMQAYNFARVYLSAGLLFVVLNFVHSYATALEEMERRKLRWALFGLISGTAVFLALWVLPDVFWQQPLVPEEFILLFVSIIPISLAISILRHHLLDIDLLLNRSTVYLAVLVVLLAVYVTVLAAFSASLGLAAFKTHFISLTVATLAVAFLFEPLRQRVQQLVDRLFFRVRYNFLKVQQAFSKELEGTISVQGVADSLCETISAHLQPEVAGVFLTTNRGTALKLSCGELPHSQQAEQVLARRIDAFPGGHPTLALPEMVEPHARFQPVTAAHLAGVGGVLITRLRTEPGTSCGAIVLGQKKSGARFSLEDIDLLNAFGSQAAATIERIRLHQELLLKEAETERLAELNRLKSYFVSSVSHELKTPLTSIKMFAEVMRTGETADEAKTAEYLEIIEGESERLSRLIDNVLDFAQIERGTKKYTFKRIDLNEIVDKVVQAMQYTLRMQTFEMEVALAATPCPVRADEDAVQQALINLIANAMKYAGDEKIVIVRTAKNDDTVDLSVTDRGIGIAPADRDRLFEPFFRSSDARAQTVSGAGIGLALVKHTMDAHGGQIHVESMPGKGSTFTLQFPAEAEP